MPRARASARRRAEGIGPSLSVVLREVEGELDLGALDQLLLLERGSAAQGKQGMIGDGVGVEGGVGNGEVAGIAGVGLDGNGVGGAGDGGGVVFEGMRRRLFEGEGDRG